MRIAFLGAVLLGMANVARAQEAGYETSFESGSAGWTFASTVSTITWSMDSSGSLPGGISSQGTKSLNYNDGVDYYYSSSSSNSGTAASPVIGLCGLRNPLLSFWCNYQTDGRIGYDVRRITVAPNVGSVLRETLGTTGYGANVGPCEASGSWHRHKIYLSSSWHSVQVVFSFDTVDATDNKYGGWAIDLFQVTGEPVSMTPVVLYAENFDGGLGGWETQSTDPYVRWNADPSPAAIGAEASYRSAPNSLNFNDATDYETWSSGVSVKTSGDAVSPWIDISSRCHPTLNFWCNYATGDSVSSKDLDPIRRVEVSNDNFATTLLSSKVSGQCGTSGFWHKHAIELDPAWGAIRLRFVFDSQDGVGNAAAGWGIDDLTVEVLEEAPGGDDAGEKSASSGACGGSVVRVPMSYALLWLPLLLLLRRRIERFRT